MNSVKSCIILAGGLGTRLRKTVSDVPKCLAIVAGKPFIDYVIGYARLQGVENFTFSLGYKAEDIILHLKTNHSNLNYNYTIETEPLGTGGGILLSSEKMDDDHFFVFNGDTLFQADLKSMSQLHLNQHNDITIALKEMENFDRYGSVDLKEEKVVAFNEKQFKDKGLINGGIYLISKKVFSAFRPGDTFSFEKDVLEPYTTHGKVGGKVFNGYFIDIGIPEDYTKANTDLKDITTL